MAVERLLQIHVALLASLGTLLLGMGQRSPILPAVVIFAAITSVIFTDKLRWFWLNRTLGNLAALGAVIFSAMDYWNNASEQQLLAIANLLVYLQIVLLYQQKNERRYWELAVLSLLQVVVAAALNLGFEFGVLLIMYMLTAFSSLSLFFVYREGLHFCAADTPKPAPSPATGTQPKTRSVRRRLLGDPIQVEPAQAASTFAMNLLGWSFVRHICAMGVMTMIFTVVLFYTVPRMGNAVWGNSASNPSVGFSTEVTFDEKREIRQSNEIVMRITFLKAGTNEPLRIAGEPYINGTVLTDYHTEDGVSSWRTSHAGKGFKLPRAPEGVPLVIQETVLAATGDSILFATPPGYAVEGTPPEVRYDPRSGQYYRRTDYTGPGARSYAYSLGTSAFRDNWQSPFIPYGNPNESLETLPLDTAQQSLPREEQARLRQLKWERMGKELEFEKKLLLQIDPTRFPQLVATANRLVGKVDPQERDVRARLLQDFFRAPATFKYTLDFSTLKRTPGVDPIEDFVANHRTGHCEYFASALCLMLRSQGIPARIVVGYKGGEHNVVGGYYWVRQLHAHAWVEAYLEPDQIPDGVIPPYQSTARGAWMRLDPTPASDDANDVGLGLDMIAGLGDIMDYAQLLWDDYVLGLNSERQHSSIYRPLAERASNAISNMFDTSELQESVSNTLASLGLDLDDPSMQNSWFSWRAGLITIIVCSIVVLMYQVLVPATRWLLRRFHAQAAHSPRARRQVVEFYQQLEALLARLDIRRQATETQQEFAASAGQRLAALGPEASGLRDLPGEVAAAFYRVRFGEAPLTTEQSQAIAASLTQLTQVVNAQLAEAPAKRR